MFMTATSSRVVLRLAMVATALSLAFADAVYAQVVVVPPTPQIGSSNPITAEPQWRDPTRGLVSCSYFKTLLLPTTTQNPSATLLRLHAPVHGQRSCSRRTLP